MKQKRNKKQKKKIVNGNFSRGTSAINGCISPGRERQQKWPLDCDIIGPFTLRKHVGPIDILKIQGDYCHLL